MQSLIKNREGKKLSVLVEQGKDAQKLAFVMHGLSGNKEQAHIRAMAEAFLESNYTVVTFDTTNTFGESDGDYQDATITNYYADLEDVIAWAGWQEWFCEPFVLCGHSLGGISTALFAEKHPDKVSALAPISTVVSGQLSFEAYESSDNMEDLVKWKREGISVSYSQDGTREKRLKWSHMEDRLKYDLLPAADSLTMPVLLVVGDKDESTPFTHQQILFEALKTTKEMHIIKDALHSFYEPHERAELKQIIKAWLQKL